MIRAAQPLGARPGGRAPRQNWGKFEAHKWGGFTGRLEKEANGAGPELIVLGRDEAGKPRAARFPAGHDGLVAKAAKAMNLAVCKASSEVLAELTKKLPPGRLYSTGRSFVPSVGRTLYDRLVEQLKLAGQQVPSETEQSDEGQSGAEQPVPGLPTSWDDIAVGHLVIAQEMKWDGWWEAIVPCNGARRPETSRDSMRRWRAGAGPQAGPRTRTSAAQP
jgi:hypothetical protein